MAGLQKDDADGLTPQQREFVNAYLAVPNAHRAALVAGYSERSAASYGSELLRNAKVRKAIDKEHQQRAEAWAVTKERVIGEISRRAFYDPGEIAGAFVVELPDGETRELIKGRAFGNGKQHVLRGLRDPDEIPFLPEDVRRCIDGWGYDKYGHFEIKLADKSKALEQLARHLGLFKDVVEVQVNETLAARLAKAKATAEGGGE